MKLLFIVHHIDFIDPQGIMQLTALAKQQGHEVKLAILTRENVIDRIKRYQPDLLCYSASTGEHRFYYQFQQTVKREFNDRVPAIMGGAHATFFPESFAESGMNAFCRAEGDQFFPEFLDCIAAKKDFHHLHNIITERGVNVLRPLLQDLDSLPFPDRDLFYECTEMSWFPIKSFMFSRGCPYPCTYCFNHSYKKLYNYQGVKTRRNSVDYAIEQILQVKARWPLQFIKFYDDIFAFPNDPWLEEFCTKYKDKVGLPFHCACRCDLANEDMMKLLKMAGCHSVNMSIEAGTPELRNQLLKRNMSDEQIVNAFSLARKYGFKTFCNSILGLPGSTGADDMRTIDLNIKSNVTFAEFPVLYPYPKTELGEYCREKGYFQGDYNRLHFSYQTRSPLSCFSEKEKDILLRISLLGTVVVWLPWLRGLVYHALKYLPLNKLYFWAYLLAKIHLVKNRIYPHRLTFSQAVFMFKKSFLVDESKHFEPH